MTAAEQLDRLSHALAAELQKIGGAMDAGVPADTARLAEIVAAIDPLAAELGPEEAAKVKPRLLGLLAELDLVQARMAEAHAALQAQLRSAGTRHRAVNAYNRPPKR